MSDINFSFLQMIAQSLIAPIGICVSLIALGSYRKFRNWRLLFLSVAFLLLSIPHIFELMFIVARPGISQWVFGELFYVSILFSMATVVPFALLAYVYNDERKRQSIEISRAQWIGGSIVIGIMVVFSLYAVLYNYSNSYGSLNFGSLEFLNLAYLFLGSINSVLVVLIIISLISYYRAKETRNTLVVMVGFIFLLIGQGYEIFTSLSYGILSLSYDPAIGLITSWIELTGYIAFLIALLRLKVFR